MTEPDYSDLANLEFEKIAEFVEKAHFQGNSEAFKMGMACLILKHKESINKSDTQSVKADLKVMQEGLIKMDDKINDISNKLELPPTAEAQTYANANEQLNTIIVKQSKTQQVPIKIIESEIKKSIINSKLNIKINSIIPKKTAVIIKTRENIQKVQSLIEIINKNTTYQNKFKAYMPKKSDPTVVLKNVSSDNDITTILTLSEPWISVSYIAKSFSNIHDRLQDQLFIDFQRCSIKTESFVQQCQNCFKFHHKTGECRNPKICRQCGETKSSNHTCSTQQQCCVNCKNSSNQEHGTDHMPNNDKCPIYMAQKIRLHNSTQFYPDTIKNLLQTYERHPIILSGDLNARHTLWYDRIVNKHGELFCELVNEQALHIHNNKNPTCITLNVLSSTECLITNCWNSNSLLQEKSPRRPGHPRRNLTRRKLTGQLSVSIFAHNRFETSNTT
ncbi:hypothetical protein SSS_02905 [Sarcoptes scabiei]|uniref:Endonuclease/exonuclease/phosphatase domain-containing protein n=1 Tax=Sarcoptes scabiei TaxID=52283 RepID=A0A834R0C5_SARSC|nr:hypothetical protein SSS_02905 [Sarcoptes scabiei]